MQDKDTAFALSEFRNIMGSTQIRKQKIRLLCHKCYNMGSMGALWGKVEWCVGLGKMSQRKTTSLWMSVSYSGKGQDIACVNVRCRSWESSQLLVKVKWDVKLWAVMSGASYTSSQDLTVQLSKEFHKLIDFMFVAWNQPGWNIYTMEIGKHRPWYLTAHC